MKALKKKKCSPPKLLTQITIFSWVKDTTDHIMKFNYNNYIGLKNIQSSSNENK